MVLFCRMPTCHLTHLRPCTFMCSFSFQRQVRLPILRLTPNDYRALHDAIRPILNTEVPPLLSPHRLPSRKYLHPFFLLIKVQSHTEHRTQQRHAKSQSIGSLTDSTELRTVTPQRTLASGEALVAVNWANKSEKTRLCVPSEPQD